MAKDYYGTLGVKKGATQKEIKSAFRKLARKGYLLLCHTESLVNLSTAFELVHLRQDMVYRKP